MSKEGILEALKKAQEETLRAIQSGASWVGSTLGRLPLLSSLKAETSEKSTERDETHYFMVPFRACEGGYVLFQARRLPDGHGPSNDLPKLRVFHLPGPGTESLLEKLVVHSMTESDVSTDAPLAERLHAIADEIDKQSGRVTGGLLLIGGAVAFVNPLLGVGIAAKAILPSLGALLSREGLMYVAGMIKDRQTRVHEETRKNAATKELRSVTLKTYVNPVLQTLDKALCSDAHEFDPNIHDEFGVFSENGLDTLEMIGLSARAVTSVYKDILADEHSWSKAGLGREDVAWLRSLEGFGQK